MHHNLLESKFSVMNCLQVGGNSYLLWAIDNYRDCCKLADDIADREVPAVDWVEETEKINEIITGLR